MEGTEEEIIIEEEEGGGEEALKRLREKLKLCIAEKQEYLEGWQRLRADYANEKRDSTTRLSRLHSLASSEAAEKIIPLVDAFDLAFSAPGWKDIDPSWRTGVERLKDETLRALKELGVEPFSPVGENFDPACMTASREAEGPPNTVIAVDRVGFKSENMCVRPAYVAVGK